MLSVSIYRPSVTKTRQIPASKGIYVVLSSDEHRGEAQVLFANLEAAEKFADDLYMQVVALRAEYYRSAAVATA